MLSFKSGGFDTVKVVFELDEPIPIFDEAYVAQMRRKWKVKEASEPSRIEGSDEPTMSMVFSYQSPENSTLRYRIYYGASRFSVEFSVPRLKDDSILNISLATSGEVAYWVKQVQEHFSDLLPEPISSSFLKFGRQDYAVDILCGDLRSAVIASLSRFSFKYARNQRKQIFPDTGARVHTQQHTFRGYVKAAELTKKLSVKQREKYAKQLAEISAGGVIRLEHANSQKGGLPFDTLQTGSKRFADLLEIGYANTKIYLGGLDDIQRRLWGLDISSRLKTSIHSFAALYAQYGEEGIVHVMPRSTFYRRKRQFRNLGFSLADLHTPAELDFSPLIKYLRSL